ncbi:iron chelate uptake ABC transporter family permease subunit [Streptomyces sp. ID03-2B]|uniref:FecCD family ABC transporter permease n=1 Tax=Streptomyces caviscabies TaxID=90079 RepID=A0ABW2MEZ8_9ACTN|nr:MULTISPECIES: iron chelate uptake ABC transporter family permease subunit [unclassified Streptomyces]MDX3506454.1 iron chelate uptake ABC transporter family permease subunit [Streptomyces sp. ATCC51928]MDX3589931.1 iron chelate uptake ABC transporter family permease subunit [Streptomyces sp. ID03-2B]MDX5522301.1 iron chelate uptake ABC transporter family permease subunit [Streptomyces sp. DE06-01C]
MRRPGKVGFGRTTWTLRRGGVALRIDRRAVLVCAVLTVVVAALSVMTLGTGSIGLTPVQVLSALLDPDADPRARLVVVTWRLPRLLFAAVCGAALAISGALFQSLTKNPLGSPDVIGFASGSYAGASVVMLLLGTANYLAVASGSLIGGALTALLVYVLAYRGGLQPFRLIIVGIAVGAFLGSITSMLLLSVSPQQAMLAATWGAGSLSGLGFEQLRLTALVFAVLVVGSALVVRPLVHLEMGDDAAVALGVRVRRARLTATVVGVALTALVTAAAGPIAFIALAAPQIAQRLTRSSTTLRIVPAALTGAAVLVGADHIAQRIDLPVGVVTVCVGGAYLAWLLARQYAGRRR